MPIQAPQWTDFLTCPVCLYDFDDVSRLPISLGCGHSICRVCLDNLSGSLCPFDQAAIPAEARDLPPSIALLQLLNLGWEKFAGGLPATVSPEFHGDYRASVKCIEALAVYLRPLSKANCDLEATSVLSRPLQRKLVTLINCQLGLDDGRVRAVRAARSIGERTVTELILQHQNGQISTNLWAAVRARGCQFLGPAMQEETLNLVLLALDHGASLSRKVLVLFVVQRLVQQFPQASKTSVGHVVQLLYRASCFKVTKREEESSLMELKEEFRQYDALRKEHDTQIVQIALEAGLRISPEQWSSLLYGDLTHKSHMQSIIDKLQTPESFGSSIRELTVALQRSSDPAQLSKLRCKLEQLAAIDQSPDTKTYPWKDVRESLQATQDVVAGLADFLRNHSPTRRAQEQQTQSIKYKTSMCRDIVQKGGCPRGTSCTFAHSEEELERYRSRSRRMLTSMNRQNSRPMDRSFDPHPRAETPLPAPGSMRGPQAGPAMPSLAPSPRLAHPLTPGPYRQPTHPDFQSPYLGVTTPRPLSNEARSPQPPPPSHSPYQRPIMPINPRVGLPFHHRMRGQVPIEQRYSAPPDRRSHWTQSTISQGSSYGPGRVDPGEVDPREVHGQLTKQGYRAPPDHRGHWSQSAMSQGSSYGGGYTPGRGGDGSRVDPGPPVDPRSSEPSKQQLKIELPGMNGQEEGLSLQQLEQHKNKIQGMLDNFLSPPRNPYAASLSEGFAVGSPPEFVVGSPSRLADDPEHRYVATAGTLGRHSNSKDGLEGSTWSNIRRSDLHTRETDSKYTTSISAVQRLHLHGGGSSPEIPGGENPATLGKHNMHEFEQMSKNELEKTLEQEKNAASSHYERSSKIQMEIMRRNNVEEHVDDVSLAPVEQGQFVRHPGPASRKAITYHKTTGPVKVHAGSSSIAPVTLMLDCHVSPGIQSTPGVYDYFQTGLNWNQPNLKLWDSLPPSRHQMSESDVKNAKNILKAELENVSQKIDKKHGENSANDSFLLLREESALSDVWPTKEHSHAFSESHHHPPAQGICSGRAPGQKSSQQESLWGLPNGAGDGEGVGELPWMDKEYGPGRYDSGDSASRPSPYAGKW